MDEALGVLDAPEVEAEPVETQPEPSEGSGEPAEGQEAANPQANAYSTQFTREMRAQIKAWRDANPQNPQIAKIARQALDNHERMFTLSQIEPKGIDGVRERYALLDSLAVGESKGVDAITAMQERLQGVEEVDGYLAQGDPRAFDALGEDFNAGLAKLAPAYLDRVQKSDPEAYAAAILPHFVRELASSDLVKEFNALVDVLNAQNDPRFDDKTKMQFTLTQIGKMATWFNAQQERAGKIPQGNPVGNGHATQDDERAALETERQTFHWDSKIKPGLVQHENQTFETLFAPYQRRLKLDDGAKNALMADFKSGLSQAAGADKQYMTQMGMYRKQKAPDAGAVQNYVKNAIGKHAKSVLEAAVTARYGRFLGAQPKPAQQQGQNGNGKKPMPPAEPQVEIRSVMPPREQIDFRRTPVNWFASSYPGGKKYYLTSGKIVQIRPQA